LIANTGKITNLAKARTPLSATLPSSQKAFFTFFLTAEALSSKSILESWGNEEHVSNERLKWMDGWMNGRMNGREDR